VKTHWQLDAALIPSLAREVAADNGNFPSRNKLRLLRVVQHMAKDLFSVYAALSFTASSTVDAVMFAVLGDSQHTRANMQTMVDPISSPISQCQANLLALLSEFAKASAPNEFTDRWSLLGFCGGNVADNVELRMEARKVVLQLSAGLLDVMEMRWCKPPYTLAVLSCPDAPVASKKVWGDIAFVARISSEIMGNIK
jgi:hypothetical protein